MLVRTRGSNAAIDLQYTIGTYGNGWISALDNDDSYLGIESIHFDTPNSVFVGITIEIYPDGSLRRLYKRDFTDTEYEEYTLGDWFCGSISSCSVNTFYRCGHYSSLDGRAIIKQQNTYPNRNTYKFEVQLSNSAQKCVGFYSNSY